MNFYPMRDDVYLLGRRIGIRSFELQAVVHTSVLHHCTADVAREIGVFSTSHPTSNSLYLSVRSDGLTFTVLF